MAERLTETIIRISTPPEDGAAFDQWLDATDGIDFLQDNALGDEFAFYATPGGTFIHSILVPAANVTPPDVEDLMKWSFNAYGTWGVNYTVTEALREARHLRGPRVLCDRTGKPLTQKVIQVLVRRTARRANVKPGIHILRHTFCSHLAMRGAPAKAIQELAGHQDLATTQQYMHLSPAALDAAIRLLDSGQTSRVGNNLEAAGTGVWKALTVSALWLASRSS